MANENNENLEFSLEEELKADDQGELKQKIQTQLNDQILQIEKVLSAGVTPDEYNSLNQVRIGLQSALVILEKVWQHFHKTKA